MNWFIDPITVAENSRLTPTQKYPNVTVIRGAVRELIKKFETAGDVKDIKKTKNKYNNEVPATVAKKFKDAIKETIRITRFHIQRISAHKIYPLKPVFNQKIFRRG